MHRIDGYEFIKVIREREFVAAMLALATCAAVAAEKTPTTRTMGWQASLGSGTVFSYADFDAAGAPHAMGIAFSPEALEGLPASSNNHHCTERHSDGSIGPATKCIQTHEYVIPLPDALTRRADTPFKWVLLNWNHVGHIPPGIYDVPHFDVHFMIAPIDKIFAIQAGDCGPEKVRCDQFAIARKPVPADYIHADYKDVEAVVPAMGNHLIDLTGPEFNGQPFTRSMIFGVYDGKITFYEEMVTRTHLLSKPNQCTPIKLPKAYAVTGYYPTSSCIQYDAQRGEYTVSMEQFVLRQASARLIGTNP
jgi:hypothetical protein